MKRDPLDYERKRLVLPGSFAAWQHARFGIISMACACFVVLTFCTVGCFATGASIGFTKRWFLMLGLVLFCGGSAGVLGTDFDRHRGLATIGIFLNFGLLLAGCVLLPSALSAAR